MQILVIDGQGGRLGAQLVKEIKAAFPETALCAIGTNAIATAAMLKAGADNGATGENPVVVACREADVIISKGQGNFESLYGEGLNPYFMFLCKCELFVRRFGLQQFASVCAREDRIKMIF